MAARMRRLVHGLLAAGFALVIALVLWLGQGLPSATDAGMPDAAAADAAATGMARLAPAVPLTGDWRGTLVVGAHRSELHFSLREQDGQLSGTVRFPVGAGVVRAGSRRADQVSLETANTQAATGQLLLTRFSGRYANDQLHLTMLTENGSDALTLQRIR